MDCTLRAAAKGTAAVTSDRAQNHRGSVSRRPVHGSQFLASFCTPQHQPTTNHHSRQRSLAVTAAAPSTAAANTTSRISSNSSRTVRVSITAPQPAHLYDRNRHASAAAPVASAGSGSVFTATPETQNGTARAPAGAAADASASAEQQQQQAPILPAALAGGSVMTDETVPEGHKGLHGFLYGDSGADVHDSRSKVYTARAGEDDGSVLVPLADYIGSREGNKFAGVYAVFDAQGVPQYVGYSRNVVLSLKSHQSSEEVGAVCTGVRVKVFTDAALVTRSRMEEERQQWLHQLCKEAGLAELKGTTDELHLWEGPNGPGTAAMSALERAEYEEKKLKLRKAMGENLYDDVEGETLDSKERRLALLQAVEGDDWSSVISSQTKSTLPVSETQPAPSAAAATAADAAAVPDNGRKISPFEMRPGAAAAAAAVAPVVLSVEAVDDALNVVRPYLIADGGNVEVVGVEDGIVALRLQGACGTCPSSTATMKMGIERALVERFGDQIREVVQVNPYSDNIPTVATVDAHLDMLRPAINNFGGSVEVLLVNATAGECEVRYQGPAPIGMGIQAAIKDKFPTLRTVKLVD